MSDWKNSSGVGGFSRGTLLIMAVVAAIILIDALMRSGLWS